MTRPPCPRRHLRRGRLLRAVTALLAGSLALTAHASPAAAHGGEGVLSLDRLTPVGDPGSGRWEVGVLLSFASDGHPAEGATVNVAGEDAAGARLTPVGLVASGDGRYAATVELPGPGTWNLRVVSVEPPAQLSLEPLTVPEPSTTLPPATGTSATGTSGIGDEGDGGVAGTPGTPDPGDEMDEGIGPGWLLVVVALAVGGLVAWIVAARSGGRGRRADPPGGG